MLVVEVQHEVHASCDEVEDGDGHFEEVVACDAHAAQKQIHQTLAPHEVQEEEHLLHLLYAYLHSQNDEGKGDEVDGDHIQ